MSQATPDPRESTSFQFTDCQYTPAEGVIRLVYRFDNGPELVERITFPHAPWPPEASRQSAFQSALEILHLVAGVSYYKAGLSPHMQLRQSSSLAGISGFLTELYVEGLAEMGYLNQLDVAGRVKFDAEEAGANQRIEPDQAGTGNSLILPDRALVAMGGGKDSLVGLDLMQQAGVEVLPVCIGGSELIMHTVKAAGLPLLRIRRQLAPQLAKMNRTGAWNGHVPVTAINSAILLCASILYGFRYIVFSNERSADEATLLSREGTGINHQYSKSSSFEQNFRQVIAEQVSRDIEYFSILRPFSEVGIVERFSTMKKYHPIYSSCNRNFHLDGPHIEGRWCLECPKCLFAALSLALFLAPREVAAIQGGDLLDDISQEEGFRALCNLGREKPFECVGEAGESRAAMAQLSRKPEWRDHAIVRLLQADLNRVGVPELDELMQPSAKHCIPASLLKSLEQAGEFDARH